MIKLELGGGTNRRGDSTVVIDPMHPFGELPEYRRLAQETPWPFANEEVDSIYASHVMEHIPAGEDRIKVFNEAHRVLKSGGNFDILVPLVGYTDGITGMGVPVNGWYAFADPTHVSYWWFPESLLYFCEGDFKAHADYGISLWILESWHINNGFEGVARLIKP